MTRLSFRSQAGGLEDLAMTDYDLWQALMKIPLPLQDAAIFLKAHYWGVGYEAAAIVAFSHKANQKQKPNDTDAGNVVGGIKPQLTVNDIVEVIASTQPNWHTGLSLFIRYNLSFSRRRLVVLVCV